jgi:RNA polymerase sigma-70 factor (ECF subfamily)
LSELRRPLLRFAQLQLRNESLAEDVVSETLLALLENPGRFEGRSSLRTYATGILKFKIIDVLRQRGREVHIEPLDEQTQDDALDALFLQDGHWKEPPPAWQQPDRALEQAQFFDTLQVCVDRLPPKLGRVFMMREWLEREVDDICGELGITANHCGVLLYRARMQLRDCLGRGWFQEAA